MPNENTEHEKQESMNYNDRLDGYGFGESESRDKEQDYQKDEHFTRHCIDMGEGYRRHHDEPYTLDEYGLRNQYGPVDQYSFREVSFTYIKHCENRRKKEMEEKENDESGSV